MTGETDVTGITAKRWLDIWRWGNDTNMWANCYAL